tara:strand:+ start:31 stop:246 length:216 start_codon:yes stop_codon:yes gene_type:complete
MSYFEIIKRYMQFHKKTSIGSSNFMIKILIRIAIACILIFIILMLVDRINFPAPNKKIEKIISNEKLKTIN